MIEALRWCVDLSALLSLGCFVVAVAIRIVIWGPDDMSNDVDGWYFAMFFLFGLLPFFLINAVYGLACLVTGAEIGDRLRWLGISAAPLLCVAVTMLKAQTLNEATYWGIALSFLMVNLCLAFVCLRKLALMAWQSWVLRRRNGR